MKRWIDSNGISHIEWIVPWFNITAEDQEIVARYMRQAMADQSKLYDNDRSPKKKPKKGDRRTINGVEMESTGALDTPGTADEPPGHVEDGHMWRPIKQEVPTS